MAGLLAGRLALVTGGGSGIGRAVCQALAKEGAAVAAADINRQQAEETIQLLNKDVQTKAYEVDVSSSASVNTLLGNVKQDFSVAPCIAVNAAGITRDKFLLKMDEKSFDDVINVNLKGTYLVNQAFGRAVAEAKLELASIVNISSIVGKTGNIGQANYAASKSGVIGLTKTAAMELAKFNIRVNCVLPGFIQTPMTETVPEKVMGVVVMLTPLMRMGKPEEIADACVFLASEKSSFITGVALEVTGGLNM
ncbi:(3R)-3-hydroxyacyl-CoA dehydrogenase-like [Littorina saxatilis]|uniref:(3R)-3-hydroxyacyl-CoA dehydrogenase n=1 Tax=Littorina saxatilis TaxID=31220 RepID=A0AAN9AXR2_9CAEN